MKILNLFRQPALKEHITNEKYLPFFNKHDNFSLAWSKSIADSPSGSSCLSVLQDFIQGHGFSDPDLEKFIIDSRGTTFWQFHQQTSDCFAEHSGVYWLIRYNLAGQITEFEILPFESCRLGAPNSSGYIPKIFYNPFFGTNDYKGPNDKHTRVYNTFNPEAVTEQIKAEGDNFKGQVLYFGTTNTISRFYAIHEAYASKKWMKIESGISDYHDENINNGMLQPHMLVMRGDPNAPSTNPDYDNENGTDKPITVAQEFDQVVGDNFMGAKRIGNLWVQWVGIGEEAPEIIPFPSNNNGDLFVTIDNQATKKITIAWKVPGVLANIQEGMSLGGDGNQIRVAVKLMQQRVVKKQRIITDQYSRILQLMATPYLNPITITPWNPYKELEVLDDKIWNAMTSQERRKWIQENTEIELIEEDNELLDQPTIPSAAISNAIPVAFPEKIRNKIKKTLEYVDKMQLKCTGKGGMELSQRIVDNVSMGQKEMNRIYKYLKKRLHLKDEPNDNCDVVAFNLWGGAEMHDFLEQELNRLKAWLN